MSKQEKETPATPESVWEFLIKLGEEIKEWKEAQRISAEEWKEAQRISAAEFDKRMKESAAEADKRAEESEKEWAEIRKAQKQLNKQIGGIDDSIGKMTEEMIANSLIKDMTFAGIKFDYIIRNQKKHLKEIDLKGEFDVVLENCNTVALIEAKHKLRKKDVDKLLNVKVDSFRRLFPLYKNYKIILGVGGGSFEDGAEEEAKENGIGVIKVVGDKVEYYTEGIRVY